MKKWAVCYVERSRDIKKWVVITAESGRKAVEVVKRYYPSPGYRVIGCYKELPAWAWN